VLIRKSVLTQCYGGDEQVLTYASVLHYGSSLQTKPLYGHILYFIRLIVTLLSQPKNCVNLAHVILPITYVDVDEFYNPSGDFIEPHDADV
jgi:hypothetical protein